jgi:phenylpyruvate tautomerase PptA (4-oxalocrotonate tautomerase family)
MPLLHIHSSSKTVNEKVIQEVHQAGAQILAEVLGKSTDYVMVLVNTASALSFAQDDQTPCAYLEVKNIGGFTPKTTEELSLRLCELVNQKLQTPANRVYIEFQNAERYLWGWNGKTFA